VGFQKNGFYLAKIEILADQTSLTHKGRQILTNNLENNPKQLV